MNKNKPILIILSLITLLGGYWLFFRKKEDIKSTLFKTETPIRKNLVQYVNSSGTLKTKDEITVGSLVAGRVVKIIADDNDFVKKNQVLTILDDGIGDSAIKQLQASLQEKKVNLEYQEKFYQRQKELFKANQISKDTFEQYTRDLNVLIAQVKQKEAELEIKQKEYNNLFIKSPADGIVIAKEIDLGQMITAQLQATVLYVIAKDLQKMEANVDIDEADIGMVKVGQKAIFTVDAFPKLKFKAKVRQIRYLAKIVDNVVTYATILNVNNPELKLRPGMTTDVNIKVKTATNALVVHNKSLRINNIILKQVAQKLNFYVENIPEFDEKSEIDHVWILENENKFKQVKVTLGATEGKYTQIISDNINNNTKIITEVTQTERDNKFLKQIFSKPGTIGSGKK